MLLSRETPPNEAKSQPSQDRAIVRHRPAIAGRSVRVASGDLQSFYARAIRLLAWALPRSIALFFQCLACPDQLTAPAPPRGRARSRADAVAHRTNDGD